MFDADKAAREAQAKKWREQIDAVVGKKGPPAQTPPAQTPQPGERPREFIERRMHELEQDKREKGSE